MVKAIRGFRRQARLPLLVGQGLCRARPPSAAKALAAAGAKHIYLAGKPGDSRKALEAAGIGTFLYQGCDTLELLQDAYERLGA